MENGSRELKKYQILNHIAEVQKERMAPLDQLQRELTVLNAYEEGFYQSKEFLKVLGSLREVMSQ
jgi:cell shape-determining protein MreC